jgi:hypothetical protein
MLPLTDLSECCVDLSPLFLSTAVAPCLIRQRLALRNKVRNTQQSWGCQNDPTVPNCTGVKLVCSCLRGFHKYFLASLDLRAKGHVPYGIGVRLKLEAFVPSDVLSSLLGTSYKQILYQRRNVRSVHGPI